MTHVARLPIALFLYVLITTSFCLCSDIPCVFDENIANLTADQLETLQNDTPQLEGVPEISDVGDDMVIELSTASGSQSGDGSTVARKISDIKKEINEKVDVDNPTTRKKAVILAAKYPGDHTIDQICSIYDYMRDGWHYVADIRGIDYFSAASESLDIGEELGCAGAGDCDDFAILMAALIESIGGTTRIVLAYNKTEGHAYTEVYLGNLNVDGPKLNQIVNWLKGEYGTERIFTHVNPDTKDVWLNLDWWGEDASDLSHPGGPFYQGEKHVVLSIRDQFGTSSIRPPEETIGKKTARDAKNSPPSITSLLPNLPSPQGAGTCVTWRAMAYDPDGDEIEFKFMQSPPVGGWIDMTGWIKSDTWTWNTTESDVGINEIRLLVRDGNHMDSDDSRDATFLINFSPPTTTTDGEVSYTSTSMSFGSSYSGSSGFGSSTSHMSSW